jgi:hypothetical protein
MYDYDDVARGAPSIGKALADAATSPWRGIASRAVLRFTQRLQSPL